jgi:hypothetical protein
MEGRTQANLRDSEPWATEGKSLHLFPMPRQLWKTYVLPTGSLVGSMFSLYKMPSNRGAGYDCWKMARLFLKKRPRWGPFIYPDVHLTRNAHLMICSLTSPVDLFIYMNGTKQTHLWHRSAQCLARNKKPLALKDEICEAVVQAMQMEEDTIPADSMTS